MEKFGNYFSDLRTSRGITLREFCRRTNIDPSNWSKVERSVISPPRSKRTIESALEAIEVDKNSEEYNIALDLGLLETIPDDFVAEKAILRELPVFFRTVRGEIPKEEDLQKLIEFLKKD
jgi:transcriptional regulator with XRE-family HTH domain